MALKIRTVFLYVSTSIVFFAAVYHLLLPIAAISFDSLRQRSPAFYPHLYIPERGHGPYVPNYQIINEQQEEDEIRDENTNPIQFEAGDTVQFKPQGLQNQTISIEIEGTVLSNTTNDRRFDDLNSILDESENQITNERQQQKDEFQKDNTNSIQSDSSDTIQFKPQSPHNQSIPIEAEGNDLSNTTIISQFGDVNSIMEGSDINTIMNVSVLFPAWEVLVIVPSANGFDKNYASYFCLFDTNEISPARFSGTMSYPDRRTYTCSLPKRARRRSPFRQPVLTETPDQGKMKYDPFSSPAPELLRWNFIVYNILQTDDDVVLFAKGINKRQGIDRSPTEFKCLFGYDTINAVTTYVTSSMQEVFRCQRPELTAFGQNPVKASLLIIQTNYVVPSLAYYTPQHKIANNGTKSLLCACTMVYNVAKFLKEWVIYHSKIGVDKFILYDNGSDDDLGKIVNSLTSSGYNIDTHFWLWPKTQEAGFSHAILHAKNSCKWMMYIDVDEFVYSPSWSKSTKLSKSLLPSLLPSNPYGQVVVHCYEFGPSNQTENPLTGVTQGYNCRKKVENRHKSIVFLETVHESLHNVIHHFKLKDGYKSKKMVIEQVVVNHYKYQAWPEFKAKFRRRVSTYVVDWTQKINLQSNDPAPGLGFHAVEPEGWEDRFCEVYDNRLKELTRRWFVKQNGRSGYNMEWQK